jgi:hypothetical protein
MPNQSKMVGTNEFTQDSGKAKNENGNVQLYIGLSKFLVHQEAKIHILPL